MIKSDRINRIAWMRTAVVIVVGTLVSVAIYAVVWN